MSRRFRTALSVVVVLSVSIWGQVFASSEPGAQAGARAAAAPAISSAGTPELSTSSRLQDRREVAAGTRAYSIGFQDGRFYANGWHITGEMGGVWTPPLKLVDGVWFGLDDQWVGPATKFSSGWGYTRYNLPDTSGLKLVRTDFAPDGRRGVLFGLKITNPGGSGSYPITSQTFIVVNKDLCKAGVPGGEAAAKGVVKFVDYGLGAGQSVLSQADYAALPSAIVAKSKEAVAGLQCNGVSLGG